MFPVSVRKSDDTLRYRCQTRDGRLAVGGIPSEMGGKIVASAVFLDLGITDAITDKHRKYPVSVTIPVKLAEDIAPGSQDLLGKTIEVSDQRKSQLLGVAESMECKESVSLMEKTEKSELWLLNCGSGEFLKVRCSKDKCYVEQ